MLRPKKLGRILYGLGTRLPELGDRTLQPVEVTFLPNFDPDTKITGTTDPTVDGHTVGSHHAAEALKDVRLTLYAEFTIEKAPAGAWTGKLVTGDSTGAAAAIKSDPPPATGKK
jgi:hypothetical protein